MKADVRKTIIQLALHVHGFHQMQIMYCVTNHSQMNQRM